jgi:phospholipid/cholesterol/gamma-HCH transport system permease protein
MIDHIDDPDARTGALRRSLMWLGEHAILTLEQIGRTSALVTEVMRWIWAALVLRKVRFGHHAMISQIVRVGVRSTGIVLLVCSCIGLILALQMQPPLAEYGQTDKIANIVGIAVFRELGPLISAIVLTGFAGASIAAELGTMVVGEEIEALEAHALNPIRFLVMPRMIATTFSLILLTVLADIAAVGAGMAVTVNFLNVPADVYWENTLAQLSMTDFATGLIKAFIFGLILSAIACTNGLRVTGGATGVGRATTDTVVQTIVAVIIADLIFTAIFYSLGWA